MLGAFFLTYAKFLEDNSGLIPVDEVKRHFRWYLQRFWRRIRDKEPFRLPQYLGALLNSHLRAPHAADYRRFGEILLRAAD